MNLVLERQHAHIPRAGVVGALLAVCEGGWEVDHLCRGWTLKNRHITDDSVGGAATVTNCLLRHIVDDDVVLGAAISTD